MGYEDETMVEIPDGPEPDDFSVDDLVEEEEEESSKSIDSIFGDEEEEVEEEAQPDEQPEEQTPKAKEEPGYVRGRIEKAVQKAISETEARMRAEFDAQMAPFRAKMMEDEAQELVRTRKIADIETAREFVRMKSGQPAAAPVVPKQEEPKPQPRQANGQYAPKEDPGTSARISMLEHQAARIKARDGIDVTEEFMNNEDIKQKVVSGEMDFYDVAEMMKQPKRRPPAPVRSPNGVNGQIKSTIMSMSDKQFEQLEKMVQGGERFRE